MIICLCHDIGSGACKTHTHMPHSGLRFYTKLKSDVSHRKQAAANKPQETQRFFPENGAKGFSVVMSSNTMACLLNLYVLKQVMVKLKLKMVAKFAHENTRCRSFSIRHTGELLAFDSSNAMHPSHLSETKRYSFHPPGA